jgi:hypothetical protein
MGEAKRKRRKAQINYPEKIAWETYYFTPEILREIFAKGLQYSEPHVRHLDYVKHFLDRIHDPSKQTPLCACCDYEFARGELPEKILLMEPMDPATTRAKQIFMNVLCPKDARLEGEELAQAFRASLRKYTHFKDVFPLPDTMKTTQ